MVGFIANLFHFAMTYSLAIRIKKKEQIFDMHPKSQTLLEVHIFMKK